ncbi:hypothetical protein OG948_60395 (plasmid) [Embleya sp. NBC_00888]|uniref:hypothetical protein n=1 Tax=Embleya sp. NBC_00888 TaxID=2975960 RepID=UPI002F90F127|nr:hypothetical protein OG948_60395 [Embleya sp. NBC_00888]
MLSNEYRRKGGGSMVGATGGDAEGPFGACRTPSDRTAEVFARRWPELERWMRTAPSEHPLWEWVDEPDAPATAALDAFEELLRPLDATAWAKKRGQDFPALTTHDQLLDFRAELVVARALHLAGIAYHPGDTRVANPDFLLPDRALGIEVTTRTPAGGLHELCDRLGARLRSLPRSVGAVVTADVYPSRLREPHVQGLIEDVVRAAGARDLDTALVTSVVDDVKNGSRVTLGVELSLEGSGATWRVAPGPLAAPLGSAEHAVVEAGHAPAKARQGRSMPGRVLLAVDVSRYGGAWMRPAWVWPPFLAARVEAEHDYPFAAVAVFRQSLDTPDILDAAAGIPAHLPAASRTLFEELGAALRWSTNTE